MIILKVVSVCGTYKETLKCKTMPEALAYKAALELDNWVVTIKG